jgi:hypothetical protein
MTTFPFSGGPFNNQNLIIDMIDTTRGPVAPEEVRMEAIRTSIGLIAKVSDQGEVYRFDGEKYVWARP